MTSSLPTLVICILNLTAVCCFFSIKLHLLGLYDYDSKFSSYKINIFQFLDHNCKLERRNQKKPGVFQFYLVMWFLSNFLIVWQPIQILNGNGWRSRGFISLLQKGNEGAYLEGCFTAWQNPGRVIGMLGQLLNVYFLKATCLADQGNDSPRNYWGCWFLHFLDSSMVLVNTYTCIIEINPTTSDTHEQKKYAKQNRKNDRV